MARRNPMKIPCPECGSIDVRLSQWKNTWEKALDLFGITAMRCMSCGHRWQRSLLRVREFFYARCPRCFRLELGTWDETYYRIPDSWKLLTGIGAKKVRCHACRHNFISFRLVKKHVRSDGTPSTRGERKVEEAASGEV
jgi:DNA-directed RNA polymerase subunit M/transcription elongation factor TFIIS